MSGLGCWTLSAMVIGFRVSAGVSPIFFRALELTASALAGIGGVAMISGVLVVVVIPS